MIRINLLGIQEKAHSAERLRQLRVVYVVAAANVAVIVLTSVALNFFAGRREAGLAAHKAELQSLLEVVSDVEDEERQRTLLEEKHRVIAELERKGVGPLRILTTLSDSTPPRLWLTEFTDRAGEVTITGLAIDDPTVAQFLSRLQLSPHFKGLELVETAQAEEGHTRVKKFVMRGPLDYSGNGAHKVMQDGDAE